MFRRTTTLAALAAAALTLSACGSDSLEATGELDPEKLTIYSAQHESLTEAWARAFMEANEGVEVQIRYGGDTSMANQIVEEGEKSPADVFLTENSPAMTMVEDAGLLAKVDQATLDQVRDPFVPSSGEWTGIAARSTVLVYNPDLISEDELPESMMDLADPKWKGMWGAGVNKADFHAIIAGMIAIEGEEKTLEWLKGLKANAVITENNIVTMKTVNSGELPMGIMYHYYWYRDQAETGEGSGNTKLHFFKNEDPGAFLSTSAGGVLKSAPHPEQAQDFLAFITSPEGQEILATSDAMEYAVGEGVESAEELIPLKELDAPEVDPSQLDGEKVVELLTKAGLL